MSAVIETPRVLLEAVAAMRFPARADARLTWLMDRNSQGQLTATEQGELESLVELNESLTLVRAQALRVLGRPAS